MKQKIIAFFIAEGLEIQHGNFITESIYQITLQSFGFKKMDARWASILHFQNFLHLASFFSKFICKLIGSVIKFLFRYSIQWFKPPCEYVTKHEIRLTMEAER